MILLNGIFTYELGKRSTQFEYISRILYKYKHIDK